ncbi:MAG: fluoride efflux transporter CrcB [Cocleimonas sp.]|nr:fluoride efflux transporter CrcB [Cocleimonas sp.]
MIYTITLYLFGIILTLSLSQALVIMLGGSLGALMRFVVSSSITEKLGTSFPYGTLTVNVIGSFVMGFLAMFLVERMGLDPLLRLGIFVGFLGAFTTFSTFSMETLNLFEQGESLRALVNMFVSVAFSVLAVWLGVLLGKQFGS